MEGEIKVSLESALAKTEQDADASLKAAQDVLGAIRKIRNAAKVGSLKELSAAIDAADKAAAMLRQQLANTRTGWDFNEEAYLSGGSFAREVLGTAAEKGLRIYESDDRLFCYPVLIRVSPGDRAVLIDKTKEKRLRPTVLVEHLRVLQKKPPRFSPQTFLEALYAAYEKAVRLRGRGKELVSTDAVIPLVDVYELLTLLPGSSKEYSKQEFVRDVYLLHRSGTATTRRGARVAFHHGSTATKGRGGRVLSIVDELGEAKSYYGISFSKVEEA